MYTILIRLMLITALLQLGISFSKLTDCSSGSCIQQFRKASLDVLKIDWKPISVWPEEAKPLRR